MEIDYAFIQEKDKIELCLSPQISDPQVKDFKVSPHLEIYSLDSRNGIITLFTESINLSKKYVLKYAGVTHELIPNTVLDDFYSEKELGCTWDEKHTCFRIFSPRAIRVRLVVFTSHDDETGWEYTLKKDADGVWSIELPGHYFGKYYGYKIKGPESKSERFDKTKIIGDPYAKAVATSNDFLHRAKTLIIDPSLFRWTKDTWVGHKPGDLVIYECHLRDLTAHPSSGLSSELCGTYRGLIESTGHTGIDYLQQLGINAVEFLPIQEFGNLEIPYRVPTQGIHNTWNPYSRNHWGYMPSYFFAPESYYATGQNLEHGQYSGVFGNQVEEFKKVVKAFHGKDIAVILDVVYNHVSHYDQNCLKLADKKYYFQLDSKGHFTTRSGCGNDLNTTRPMTRRLIIDSLKYWMREYHIDGFRFDLATMIDWDTREQIRDELRKINPNVILIAEPWGGGHYDPSGFSKMDWAAWNDWFRNGIKGHDPIHGLGFIFGNGSNGYSKDMLRTLLTGTSGDSGIFIKSDHSVNYLASHDDYTLGDFIRIGSGEVAPDAVIHDLDSHVKLTKKQMQLNKLAALVLMVSQGMVMLSQGQEYAHSKVIAQTDAPDENIGQMDRDSYAKDNETNWVDYDHIDINHDLVQYYQGLIKLRKQFKSFRQIDKEHITYLENENPFAIGFLVKKQDSHDPYDFIVLLNGSDIGNRFILPEGQWVVVANSKLAGVRPLAYKSTDIVVPPTSGMILKR